MAAITARGAGYSTASLGPRSAAIRQRWSEPVIVTVSDTVAVAHVRRRCELFVRRYVHSPFPSVSCTHRPAPDARTQTVRVPPAAHVVGCCPLARRNARSWTTDGGRSRCDFSGPGDEALDPWANQTIATGTTTTPATRRTTRSLVVRRTSISRWGYRGPRARPAHPSGLRVGSAGGRPTRVPPGRRGSAP